jgi:hypothetical protein
MNAVRYACEYCVSVRKGKDGGRREVVEGEKGIKDREGKIPLWCGVNGSERGMGEI